MMLITPPIADSPYKAPALPWINPKQTFKECLQVISAGKLGIGIVIDATNKLLGNSRIKQQEPGNMKFSIYQKTLDELDVDVQMGDYFGYYETEDRVRYYTVIDDGLVKSDNKHTYGGYKPFYRTITATYVSENEFRGL